jgi:hypothetical protein
MARNVTRFQTKGVAIKDLDDFRRDLQRLVREGGTDGLSLLKAANYRVAEHVRTRAVAKAATVGKQQLRAAESMRSSKSQTRATLTAGNARVPFFGGAEFGSQIGERKNVGGPNGPNPGIGWRQFKDWKTPGSGNTGYFLFPTLRAESNAIKEMYLRELDEICKIAFPMGRL